jgi:hypothetical protein
MVIGLIVKHGAPREWISVAAWSGGGGETTVCGCGPE